MDQFDYVVVGGGTAGCVVAARLSEDPETSVCLLEAGPSDVGDQAILDLEAWMALLESGYDWDYPIEPQERGNSFMRHARARVLGGCSSHNSCIAFWTPAEDLDEWVSMGCEGWSAEECFPLLKRLENNSAEGDHHGREGPVKLRDVPPDDPCGVALLEACEQAGIPTVPFNTGKTVTHGANWFQIASDENNVRSSSSKSYLHPIMDERKNLDVRTGCRAKRLLFDDEKRCTGAEYLGPDLFRSIEVGARREVILSCGSIDDPKLLMLSGIGPAEHLREFGIDVRRRLSRRRREPRGPSRGPGDVGREAADGDDLDPVVGDRHLHDDRGGPRPARPDVPLRLGAVRHEPGPPRLPDDRERLLPDAERHPRPLAGHGAPAHPRLPRQAEGRPSLLHRSARRAGDGPRREARARDRLEAGDGRLAWRRARARARMRSRDDELLDYIHKTHNTVYHPSCTVRMGAADDPEAPLDPRLRVKGVRGLRVCDGSIMPILVAPNPVITTTMIGEKCADMVKEDAGELAESGRGLRRVRR